MSQVLFKLTNKLAPNQRKFISEIIGTFIVAPFVGIAIGVYLFGKISMAHFNPAVTLGYLITKHITKIQLAYYFARGDNRCLTRKSVCKICDWK